MSVRRWALPASFALIRKCARLPVENGTSKLVGGGELNGAGILGSDFGFHTIFSPQSIPVFRCLIIAIIAALPLSAAPETADEIAKQILAPLLNPAKVATLKGDRPANARLCKVLGWVETARQRGGDVFHSPRHRAGGGGLCWHVGGQS